MHKWQNSTDIAQGLAIVLIVVIVLVLSFIILVRENIQRMSRAKLEEEKLNLEHQQKLLETNIMVQEQERTRIAADIHDILIGKLTVLKIKNEIAYDQQEIDDLLKESISIARRFSHDLSLPMLKYTDLEQLIADLVVSWRLLFKINYKSDIRSTIVLSDNVKVQLTRILQELITNMVKHAGATTVQIHLRHTDRYLFLYVNEDGKGFDVVNQNKGLGLKNIEFRIKLINGTHKLKSKIGKGTSCLFAINNSDFNKLWSIQTLQ